MTSKPNTKFCSDTIAIYERGIQMPGFSIIPRYVQSREDTEETTVSEETFPKKTVFRDILHRVRVRSAVHIAQMDSREESGVTWVSTCSSEPGTITESSSIHRGM